MFPDRCLEPTGRKETWCGIVIERKREGENRVGKEEESALFETSFDEAS